MEPVVVIIDPTVLPDYAMHLVEVYFRRWNLRTVCLYPRSASRLRVAEANSVLDRRAVAARYWCDLEDVPRVANRLRSLHHVVAVAPHAEQTVLTAAELAEQLGLDWLPLKTVALFRDKYALKQLLRAVPSGPRVNLSARVWALQDVLDFVAQHDLARFVIKPNDGMGNSRIAFFDAETPHTSIQQYLEENVGTPLVLEEYIDGDEYCVNGQIDDEGDVRTLSVQRTVYITANGRTNLAGSIRMIHHDTREFGLSADYAAQVLRTAGLKRSPFHMEIKIDSTGPCLVEVAARLGGAGIPYDTRLAHGDRVDLFAEAAKYYADLPGELPRPDWGTYDQWYLWTVFGTAASHCRVRTLTGVRDVEEMPQFAYWVVRPKLGQGIHPTVDVGTIPWQVTLRAPDQAALASAEAQVRRTIRWNSPASPPVHLAQAVRSAGAWGSRRLATMPALLTQRVSDLSGQSGGDGMVKSHVDIRAFVLRAGFSGPVSRLATSSPVTDALRRRYVGKDESEALAMAGDLAIAGVSTTLHVRDGLVKSASDVEYQVAQYASLVRSLEQRDMGAKSEISVKLEQLGLLTEGGLEFAVVNLAEVAGFAASHGIQTTLDMESVEQVEDTLRAWRAARQQTPDLGIAIQAYLPRSEQDCRDLAMIGARVRLCKGGYPKVPGATFGRKADIDLSYIRCARVLFEGRGRPMLATHDERMVAILEALARRSGRSPDDWEMQVLNGVRPRLMSALVAQGIHVRSYVAFGKDWYAWFVGRIAEKPSNIPFLLRSVVQG